MAILTNGPLSRDRMLARLRTPLYRNSLFLLLNSAVGAVSGLVFWMVVARLYSTEDVGLGSALISAAGLLVFVAGLGTHVGLVRFLPNAGRAAPALINAALTVVGLAAALSALVFLLGVPLWSPALGAVRENLLFAAAFVLLMVPWGLLSPINAVLVASRRADFVLLNGVLFNVLRIVLALVMASVFRVFGIFASWGLGVAFALAVALILLVPRLYSGYWPLPTLRLRPARDLIGFSSVNFLADGLWNAPVWLIPLLIVNVVGSAANAHYYIAWGLATLLFAVPAATTTSLLAEGSYREERLARDAWRALRLTLLLLLPAVVALALLADRLLLLFGQSYSDEGTRLVWLLAPSAFPLAINMVWICIARVRHALRSVVVVSAAVAVITLASAFALVPSLGVIGAGVAWLCGQGIVSLYSLWRIIGVMRSPVPAIAAERSVTPPSGRSAS